jgi:hypothetical protein
MRPLTYGDSYLLNEIKQLRQALTAQQTAAERERAQSSTRITQLTAKHTNLIKTVKKLIPSRQ